MPRDGGEPFLPLLVPMGRDVVARAAHSRVRDEDALAAFERFWEAYPSRHPHSDPKKPAREKFLAAIKRGADPETVVAAAADYAGLREGQDPIYTAMAQTWLSQERWNGRTEPSAPSTTSSSGTRSGRGATRADGTFAAAMAAGARVGARLNHR